MKEMTQKGEEKHETFFKSGRPGDSVNSGSGMKTAKALLEEAIKNALFYNDTYGHDTNK